MFTRKTFSKNTAKTTRAFWALALTAVLLLALTPLPSFAMNLNMTVTGADNFSVEVEPTDRIEDVKAKIFDSKGYPVASQTLIFNGRVLEEGNTLQDYSIANNSTLTLLVTSSQGASPKLRINPTTNEWEVSYDNGTTWESLGAKATGEKGDKGDTGETGASGDKGEQGIQGAQGKPADSLLLTVALALSGVSILLNLTLVILWCVKKK